MEAVRALAPFVGTNILWTTDDVCTYLRVEKTKLRAYLAMPKFPKAIRLPSDKGAGHPRYKAMEVMQWAEGYQDRH
jgi:hypothetical protein